MRAASNMPRPPRANSTPGDSRRLRIFGIVVLGALFIFVMSMRGMARYYTDYLWFDSLELTSVWTSILGTKILLAVVFIVAFFILMWLNLFLVDRLAPVFRAPGPEEQILARYHDVVGGHGGAVRLAVSLFFAVSAGLGASTQWNNWVLFRNRVDFGTVDAQFGTDIGFYVFQLPFLTFVVDWVFTALVITFLVTAGAHYMNGGIRLQVAGEEHVTAQVKGHLSVLLGLMAVVKAADYWLARFELTTSNNGVVNGATYTDVNARLPVLNLLILIALFAAVLFLVNIRLRGWVLPTVAVGLWFVVSVVMQGAYPFVLQRIVEGSEVEREAAFIDRNIAATREAYNLNVEERRFEYREDLTGDDIVANRDNLLNVPLLDRAIVDDVFDLNQVELEFYQFPSELDVDRYEIDGEVIPVVVGARSLDVGGLSSPGWVSEHISFTHGRGVAIAPVTPSTNTAEYLVRNVPFQNNEPDDIPLEESRIYHGEGMTGYAIVGATVEEVDYLDSNDEEIRNRYDGTAGVEMGGFIRQSAFALRFWSVDPLISDLVTSESRVIYGRDIEDRLESVAPFLRFDNDPYAVVADGRIKYVVDAYTATRRYPYSQRRNPELLSSSSGLAPSFNYVRNSVKAVVDTFDGTVSLYVSDPDDPIIQAYQQAFPELFSEMSEMSEDLQAHMRYPEDMFIVQTNMLARYQIDVASQFYNEFGGWAVAQDPGGVLDANDSEAALAPSRDSRVDPYYTYLRLPGESEPDFVILRSYVEISDDDSLKEMTGLISGAGDWGEDDYGQLTLYRIQASDNTSSEDTGIASPQLVASNMATQEDISEKISLLGRGGSIVEVDDLIIVPVEDSLLYVQPFYVTPATGSALPALEQVIMAYANKAVMCPTYNETFVALFGVTVADDGREPDVGNCVGDVNVFASISGTGNSSRSDFEGDNAGLLAEVSRFLEAADVARQNGDLGQYQAFVSQALELLGGSADGADGTDANTDDANTDNADTDDANTDGAGTEGDDGADLNSGNAESNEEPTEGA